MHPFLGPALIPLPPVGLRGRREGRRGVGEHSQVLPKGCNTLRERGEVTDQRKGSIPIPIGPNNTCRGAV